MPRQGPRQPANEVTPIVSHNSSQRRRYNSTENVPRGSDAELGKFPTRQGSRTQSRRDSGLAGSDEPKAPWYSRIADRYERTFLAWLRTSLAFASIGIAVTQLFRLRSASTQSQNSVELASESVSSLLSPDYDGPAIIRISDTSERLRSLGKPLGTTFLGVAILILLVGFHRYFESQYWIIRGKFPASRGSIALIAFVAGALIIAALAVIIAISPGAVEN
ncbi:hypothetical protein ASPSYDRAFT_55546 [Aspergillus sydowii CBS 593.65]|uniref:DUF202 domain-containing protein n=1 Tax=Aspergillus sydowii CBS 593.65 TaxID=1036612 RepID=A0A1L9TU39_9EURO|nr:uncharacterized protein ASPSYDRAFT_55546 [Aspergillus sydowii CBS 593.65]OJJ62783.1 hypothetical protein ASPSYDRAFT_55546 [Aspergillus sydowii CBS 593.65]